MTSRFVLPLADVGAGITPSSGAQLFFYETGTTTPKDTYSDSAGTTTNTNPVVANSVGVFPDIFVSGAYSVVLKNSSGVQQWAADPVSEFAKFVDGGYVSKTELAAVGGSALVGTTRTEAGAVTRTVESKLRDIVSLNDFTGADDTAIFTAAAAAATIITVPFKAGGYAVNSGVVNASSTFIFLGPASQITGTATPQQLNALFFDQGQIVGGGAAVIDELKNQRIEIVAGTIRQQQHQSVSGITRSGTTATVTKIAHDYPNSAYVNILGADQSEYNGFFQISNVTTNTFDITVSGSPTTPATGTITARRPAQWDWINDSGHEPVGVDDSAPVIASTTLTIPFSKTFGRAISFVVAPDDWFARGYNASMGASVGTSSAIVYWSQDRTVSALIAWDGASFTRSYGAGQGGATLGNVEITSVSMDVSGLITVSHDYLAGTAVRLTPSMDTVGTALPYVPILGSVGNTSFTMRLFDPITNAYITTEDSKCRFNVVKSFSGEARFDGLSGDADKLGLEYGNIWFMGIFEV